MVLAIVDSRSTLGSFSFPESVLLTRHQETVSAVQIAFINTPLSYNLLWGLGIFSLHSHNWSRNALAFSWVVLEIKCHLITLISCPPSVQCIESFCLNGIIVGIVEINFNSDGSFDLAVVLVLLLFG